MKTAKRYACISIAVIGGVGLAAAAMIGFVSLNVLAFGLLSIEE